jgi:hypothetical protein
MAGKRTPEASRPLRLLTAVGLGVEAYVHIHLAPRYDHVIGSTGISQGLLFRVEGGVAILLALLVLVSGSRLLHFLAFLVAGSALAAVLGYGYGQVGALGPLPNMHDPTWSGLKIASTVALAVATLTAAALVVRRRGSASKAKKSDA